MNRIILKAPEPAQTPYFIKHFWAFISNGKIQDVISHAVEICPDCRKEIPRGTLDHGCKMINQR